MTIAEHLLQLLRTCNRIKWVGVLLVVVIAVQEVALQRSKAETYAWMGAVTVPWLVVFIAFVKRVKCPRCQNPLFRELAPSMPNAFTVLRVAKQELAGKRPLALDACPQCGCSFSEPYFGG